MARTPYDILKFIPPDHVLRHEIGHLLVGKEVGPYAGDIGFSVRNGYPHQQVSYNKYGLPSSAIVKRALGGPVMHAICDGATLEVELRRLIIEGRLFDAADCLAQSSQQTKLMFEAGFDGDWDAVRRESTLFQSAADEPLTVLRKLHAEVLQLCQEPRIRDLVEPIMADIKVWFNTPDDDYDYYVPQELYYSGSRAARLWLN